jgi:hypothetical protein
MQEKSEVLMVLKMTVLFCDVMLCRLTEKYTFYIFKAEDGSVTNETNVAVNV